MAPAASAAVASPRDLEWNPQLESPDEFRLAPPDPLVGSAEAVPPLPSRIALPLPMAPAAAPVAAVALEAAEEAYTEPTEEEMAEERAQRWGGLLARQLFDIGRPLLWAAFYVGLIWGIRAWVA